MSSFSIQCTTCRSKLKVRDHSAIGQIVSCPKCGSMVLIEAPAAKSEAARAKQPAAAALPETVADSKLGASFEEAASWFEEDSASDPGSTESSGQAPAPEEASPEKITLQFGSSPTDTQLFEPSRAPLAALATRQPLAPPAKSAPAYDTPPASPPPPAEQFESRTGEPPLLPGEDWTSASTQNRKRIALVAGAAILGIFAVVGLALLVTSGGDEPAEIAQRPPADPPPIAEQAAPATTDSAVPPPVESPPAEAPVEVAVLPQPVPAPAEQPTEISLPDQSPAEEIPQPAESVVAEVPPAEVAPAAPGLEPEEPLFTDVPPRSPPTQVDSGLTALDALLPYLEGPPPAEEPPPEPAEPISETQAPDPNEVALLPEANVDLPPVKPEPRAIDLPARMRDPIEAIEIPGTPLVEFTRLMSDFSTIPITLDPDALAQLKLTPNRQVTVVMGKTNVGEVLQDAVGRLNLLVEQGENQLTITHNRGTSGALRQARYSVGDLLASDPQGLDRLRQMVLTTIGPGTWQETGGAGQIEAVPDALLVRHNEAVHHQLVMFIEKLRLARGLPLRSSYDPLLFDTIGRTASFEPKLQQPLSLNYFDPTRLLTIVTRLEQLAEVRILIDWQALGAAGWTPDTEATLSVADANLGEALVQLLEPRGWTSRVIGPQTIQITTPEALAQKREVEFYPVAEILQSKAWQAADLQAALLPQLPVAADAVRPRLSFDPASNSLIVSASVTAQQQILQLLAELQ